jgi:hypothetical protein
MTFHFYEFLYKVPQLYKQHEGMSVHLCFISENTEWIYMKFDIGDGDVGGVYITS